MENQITYSDSIYKPLIIKTSLRSLRALQLIICGEFYGMDVTFFLIFSKKNDKSPPLHSYKDIYARIKFKNNYHNET